MIDEVEANRYNFNTNIIKVLLVMYVISNVVRLLSTLWRSNRGVVVSQN